MTIDFKNGPIATHGAIFFLGIIGLSSYLGQASSVVSLISFLLCSYSVLSTCFESYRIPQRFAASIFCLIVLLLANKNPFCLVVISSVFYFYLSQKFFWEAALWKASCALVALTVAIEIMAYWGLPGTIVLIWFWSVPFILFLMLLFLVFHRTRFLLFSFLVFCAISILINHAALSGYDNECVGVVSDAENKGLAGMSLNLIRNVTERGSLKEQTEAKDIISKDAKPKKWLVSLVATPSLRPEWLFRNALVGEYYLFAEHDDLTSFIGDRSPFNSDSFRRKGPWDTYKPVMSSLVLKGVQKDLLYCSNIGCTLKKDLMSYPLVWDYTRSGVPILLAKGSFDKGRRFVFVGDSDPSADFLAPYNPFWIRALLGMPNRVDIWNSCLLIVLAFLTLTHTQSTLRLSILISVAALFYLGASLGKDIAPQVDVSVTSTGRWLSPHYSAHFSSLPKKLIQENLLVSIERGQSNSLLDIEIITNPRVREPAIDTSPGQKIRLLVLMPGASIVTSQGTTITAGEKPLGAREMMLKSKKLWVEDARDLSVGGKVSTEAVRLQTDCYVIATGSPQRLGNVSALITR